MLFRQLNRIGDFLDQLAHEGLAIIEKEIGASKTGNLDLIGSLATLDDSTTTCRIETGGGATRSGHRTDIAARELVRGKVEDVREIPKGHALGDFRVARSEERHFGRVSVHA